jgi:IclR family transcriptional regulator, acetate operon repressor
MRHGTPPIAALGRSLALLEAILADREGLSVSALAAAIGLPRATAHRQVTTLIVEGYLARQAGTRLGPGPRLLDLIRLIDEKQMVVSAAAPLLHRLAGQLQCLVQLGTLENDMVTYRVKTGRGAGDLFTRVGMQLEAYCTAIGKVLLAHLPDARREAYLRSGPFPALTRHTITDPADLRRELAQVAEQGFARDREEIAEGLECLAVPVFDRHGAAIAAISASRQKPATARQDERRVLDWLKNTAQQVSEGIAAGWRVSSIAM